MPRLPPGPCTPFNLRARAWLIGVTFAAASVSVAAHASPRLRCQIEQGEVSQVLEFAPVADPYRVKAIDVGEHFRFKAVVAGDERHVDYIKLYTYSRNHRQAVLLHEAQYRSPQAHGISSPAALTGTQRLYSPPLGRELSYGCALVEVEP